MNKRIDTLQQKMRLSSIDGAVFATSSAMQYLLDDTTYPWQRTIHTAEPFPTKKHPNGHTMNIPDALLVIPQQGDVTLVLTEERAKTLHPSGVRLLIGFFYEISELLGSCLTGSRFWVGESCDWFIEELLHEQFPQSEVLPGEAVVEELRKIKDDKELARLRAVAEFTDRAMAQIVPLIQPGVTARELQHAIAQIARDNHCDISFPPAALFVQTDKPGAEKLFSCPLDEPMTDQNSVGFDYGYLLNGYVSDYGRSFYCGQAPDEIERGYQALQQAQLALIASIRPGMRIGDCFRKLFAEMEARGYGQYLRRSPADVAVMGHQIGIDTHERPWIHDLQDAVFEPGMVMCIEPKLWWPGKCYLRCEDMVHITENGAEFFTNFDRELFSLPIR